MLSSDLAPVILSSADLALRRTARQLRRAGVPVAFDLPSVWRVVPSPRTADQVDAGIALTYS